MVAQQDKIEVYTGNGCGYCTNAKLLLKQLGLEFTEYDVHEGDTKLKLQKRRGLDNLNNQKIPQIFINDKYIGGYDDLKLIY